LKEAEMDDIVRYVITFLAVAALIIFGLGVLVGWAF
jgi:hypothetical protein